MNFNFRLLYRSLVILFIAVAFGCTDDPAYSEDYDIKWPVPTITSISPSTTAEVSTPLIISGTGLDNVTSVTIDNKTMTIVEKTSTTLKATLPRKFNSSIITLSNLYRQTVKSSTSISPSYPDIQIAEFPAEIVKDQPFTISGTNLDLITSIIVGSNVVAISSSNATLLSVPTTGLKIKSGDQVIVDVKSTFSAVVGGKSGAIDVVD